MSALISTPNSSSNNNSNDGGDTTTVTSSITVYSVSGINHSIVPTIHKMVNTTTTTTLASNDEIALRIFNNYVGPSDPIALLISVEGWTTRATTLTNSLSTSSSQSSYGYVHLPSSEGLEDLVNVLPLSVRRIIVLEPTTTSTVMAADYPGLAVQLARVIRQVAGDVPTLRGQVCAKEACTAAHRLLLARRIPQVVRYQIEAEASLASSVNESIAISIHEAMCQLVQHTISIDQVAGAQLMV
jgi:hypothetical protein